MKNSLRFVIIFLLLSSLLYINSSSVFVSFASSVVQGLFRAPKEILYSAKIAASSDRKNIIELENRKLAQKTVELENLKRDNAALRSQFEESKENSKDFLPAKIVGFRGARQIHTIVIDQGEKSGVKKGMGVIFENFLVGVVKNVSGNYSEVILPIHPEFSITAITSINSSSGIVAGQEDFAILNRVVSTEKLEKEELVLTKGSVEREDVGVLKSRIIGKIDSIRNTKSQPFQIAKISPIIDVSSLSVVFVEKFR